MYTFNQSFNVSEEVLDFWKSWIKLEYIPHVMACGMFSSVRTLKLLTQIQDFEHTYAIQFTAQTEAQIDEIEQLFELDFEFKIATKFGDKVLFFRTLLKEENLD